MKATINGIEVEGTPDEVAKCIQIMGIVKLKVHAPEEHPSGFTPLQALEHDKNKFGYLFKDHGTANKPKGTCPSFGPCYCTGACM